MPRNKDWLDDTENITSEKTWLPEQPAESPTYPQETPYQEVTTPVTLPPAQVFHQQEAAAAQRYTVSPMQRFKEQEYKPVAQPAPTWSIENYNVDATGFNQVNTASQYWRSVYGNQNQVSPQEAGALLRGTPPQPRNSVTPQEAGNLLRGYNPPGWSQNKSPYLFNQSWYENQDDIQNYVPIAFPRLPGGWTTPPKSGAAAGGGGGGAGSLGMSRGGGGGGGGGYYGGGESPFRWWLNPSVWRI